MCSKHTPQESNIEEEDEGYIEEPEPTIYHEEVVEYNEPNVQHFGYYEPSLDSESEFPWHHPEKQVSDTEVNAPQIDMSQFFDPWNIYRGNIPPNREDSGQAEKTDHYENVRKYAWDYVPPQHSQHQIEVRHNYENTTQPQYNTNISERITQPHHHEIQHDNHSTHHYHNPPQEHNWQCNTESSQNVFQNSEYTPSVPQSTYDYNYKEDSHTHTSSHEFGNYNQQHNYSQHHNDFQQHQNHQQQPIQHSYSQSDHHSTHSHREPYYPQEHNYDNRDFHEENHEHHSQNQNETQTNNHISYSVDTEQNQISKKHNHMNDFTYLQLQNPNREEQIYTVMMDHVRMRTESVKVNGYESDSESDIYEDVSPRHPYDGFYLRHRMTIDSRGRKICSHEIPYIPRSPSPASSEDFEDALEYTPEDDSIVNGEDMQTGVAGNLARVVPGAPLQREAVDELSRRQGWEAGNIDYMGADSFDNIWAKISQTLSHSPDQDSEPQASQEEAKPVSSEQAPVEPEPVVEKESVPEVPAEKVAEVPVETKKVPEEVPELESEAAALPTPAEAPLLSEDVEVPVPASEAAEVKPEELIPVTAEAAAVEAPAESAPVEAQPEPAQEIPVAAVEALKIDEPAPKSAKSESAPELAPAKPELAAPVSAKPELAVPQTAAPEPAAPEPAAPESAAPEPAAPATEQPAAVAVSESVPEVAESKPEEPAIAEPASDSPPLANTPSKEEIPAAPAAKSERRRLQLPPPAAAAALRTPDSELEDAAALATAIIASELPAGPASPASPVSLSQIGVKPKPSTAAQIESSVPKQPKPKVEGDAPKKKIIKKVVKKEASGDAPAPVPPPRKKEKKPKEK